MRILIIGLSLTLFSCDCMQEVKGVIVNEETGAPIDSVLLFKTNRENQKVFTNENGEFELSSISGGPSGCPPMKVTIEKRGYESRTMELELYENSIVKMKQIQ